MYKIGLTGGIASGKTTVSNWFRERGVPLIDADIVAREVVEPGTEGLQEVVYAFGNDILLPDGSMNREAVGAIVFKDREKRELLNQILRRHIRARIDMLTKEFELQGRRCIVYDIPLMFETDWHKEMDEIWLVYVPFSVQLKRLMERNQYSEEEAKRRIASQMSNDEKKERSTIVIDNSGTLDTLYSQLEKLLERYASVVEYMKQKEY